MMRAIIWHRVEWLNTSLVLYRVPKFSGVHCIDLHIPNNFGADSTKIHFIGFKGEFTKVVTILHCNLHGSSPALMYLTLHK